jgi:hypothetical protein
MVRVLVMTVQGRPGQNSKIRGQCRAAKPDIDTEADSEPVRSKYQVRADIEDIHSSNLEQQFHGQGR